MEKITSVKNPLIIRLRALKGAKERRETGLFLVEGEKMLREALDSGLIPHTLLSEGETPLAARFPGYDARALHEKARRIPDGLLVSDMRGLRLTPQGFLVSNAVIAQLLL